MMDDCQYSLRRRSEIPQGYPKVRVPRPNGRGTVSRSISRVICAEVHGLDLFDLTWVARHVCDNPPCINPDHIVPGTMGDNNRDTVARGRHVCWVRRLTPGEVDQIRSDPRFVRDIAAAFNITSAHVSKIKRGESWQKVHPGPIERRDRFHKITVEQAAAIIDDPRFGREIAADYGITQGYVSHLKLGRVDRYRHLLGAQS